MKSKMMIIAVLLLTAACSPAQQTINLPTPDKNVKMTLMEALQNRHSSRTFTDKEVNNETLSQVLWAACGINRPAEEKITAPSAINAQDIVVFVCRKDGAWRYDAESHSLVFVTEKDLRKAIAGRQEFAATAPLSLVIASNKSRFGNHREGATRMGLIDSGYVSQNIALICTALGLNTVPRMSMETDVLKKELLLGDDYELILNHPIGF